LKVQDACPACGTVDVYPLIDMGRQPLSLVALTKTKGDSECQLRLPITISICEQCGHCFNTSFTHEVEYSGEGCRMWNNGHRWLRHMEELAGSVNYRYGTVPTVLEIGAGNCEFLDMLDPGFIKIAVDPAANKGGCEDQNIHVEKNYFDPSRHLPNGAGDLVVVMRHLLEHMEDPKSFMEGIAQARRHFGKNANVVVEVPSIENALTDTRLADWTYEHPQHFTRASLVSLMQRAGFETDACYRSYGGEVLVYIGHVLPFEEDTFCKLRDSFNKMSFTCCKIGAELKDMDSVAYWGGAGKSAMFLNYLGVPEDALVVDSDENKVGMYVPGTGIQITSPEKLLIDHVDTIVITTAWRKADIAEEIKRRNIPCNRILSFEQGKLVEVDRGQE